MHVLIKKKKIILHLSVCVESIETKILSWSSLRWIIKYIYLATYSEFLGEIYCLLRPQLFFNILHV